MVQVYAEPFYKRHYAGRCSIPYCFRFCSLIGIIILSFVFVLTTGGLWVKSATVLTQPKVEFSHELLVILEGAEAGSEKVWSTYSALNEALGDQLAAVSVSATNEDTNHDGLAEYIDIKVTSLDDSPVHSVKALMQFSYEIDEDVDMRMKSMAFVSHASPLPGSACYVDGELILRQKEPLGDGTTTIKYDTDVLPLAASGGAVLAEETMRMDRILEAYLSRNETTEYRYGPPVWIAGGGPFTLSAKIRVPSHQPVVYKPGSLQVLKMGWVQWLAVFVALWWILSWVEWALFHNRILETRVVSDLTPKQHRF